jgi:hypothetical protein
MLKLLDFIVIGYFIILFSSLIYALYMSKRKDKGFIGNPPINKILFVFGKFCTTLIAIAVIIQLLNFNLRMIEGIFLTDLMSSLFLILSGLFFILSIFSLKESSSFGLPQKETSLKTSGI